MISKKPKSLFKLLVGSLFLATFAIAGCNNEGEKKEPAADTPAVKPAEPAPPVQADTAKMDTADTKPVKTGD